MTPLDAQAIELIGLAEKATATCETCGGSQHIAVPHSVAKCCGMAEYECGGRGCRGPQQDCQWEWEPCPDCAALHPQPDTTSEVM